LSLTSSATGSRHCLATLMLYHSHILQTCSSAWHWRHSSSRRSGKLRSASEPPHFQQTRATASLPLRLLVAGRDLVVAATDEFDQADAVAEGIGQHGDLAPVVGLHLGLEARAGVARPVERSFDLIDHEIQVHRR